MSLAGLQSTLLGTRLTLYLGPMVVAPAPVFVIDALKSAVVEVADEGRDGFELTFSIGRSFPFAPESLVTAFPLLRPGMRVILQLWFGVLPQVLIDGFITQTRNVPSDTPGESTLVVIGEDVRVLMDLYELSMPFPQMSVTERVNFILLRYAAFLGAPTVVPCVPPSTRTVFEQICVQADTDLRYVQSLAEENGAVFYVEPTPVPMANLTYWGPENRTGLFQPPLRVNQGGETNVSEIAFEYRALQPYTVVGAVQERRTGAVLPVVTLPVAARMPLAPLPATVVNQPFVRKVQARGLGDVDYGQALVRAQAQTDEASRDVVVARGKLDTAAYNNFLKPRRNVQLSGAGLLNDGSYYVRRVRHEIQKGSFTQSFTLTREGQGPLPPLILPSLG